jgi:hypothetical protein
MAKRKRRKRLTGAEFVASQRAVGGLAHAETKRKRKRRKRKSRPQFVQFPTLRVSASGDRGRANFRWCFRWRFEKCRPHRGHAAS